MKDDLHLRLSKELLDLISMEAQRLSLPKTTFVRMVLSQYFENKK